MQTNGQRPRLLLERLEARCLLASGAEWLMDCSMSPPSRDESTEYRPLAMPSVLAEARFEFDANEPPTFVFAGRTAHGPWGPVIIVQGVSISMSGDSMPKAPPRPSDSQPASNFISLGSGQAQSTSPSNFVSAAPAPNGGKHSFGIAPPATHVTVSGAVVDVMGTAPATGGVNVRWNSAMPMLREVSSVLASVLSDAYQGAAREALTLAAGPAASMLTSAVDGRYQAATSPATHADARAAAPVATPRPELTFSAAAYGDLDAGMVQLDHAPNAAKQFDAAHDAGVLTDAELNALAATASDAADSLDNAVAGQPPETALAADSPDGGMIALAVSEPSDVHRPAPRAESDGAVAVREMQASLGVYQAFESGQDARDSALASLFSFSPTNEDSSPSPVIAPSATEDRGAAQDSSQRTIVNAILGLTLFEFFRRHRRGKSEEQSDVTPSATLARGKAASD
jgi:hypothetical protein